MADIEKAINDLEEIKGKLIPAIARMYGSGFSSVFACEKAEEKINNAIELLKQQNGLMLALEQSNASNEYLNNSVSELGETINILKDEIKRLKEQQPKKGHWIDNDDPDDNYFMCSVCGDLWILNDGTPEDNLMNYCPHCGARMDERKGGKQE